MNTSQIKTYAPKARRDFINAVTNKAHQLGLNEDPAKTKDIEFKGDTAIINGTAFPESTGKLREKLRQRINKEGFNQVMEQIAYTWFNRFMALRYMELHDYLKHGYRVLSNPKESGLPEILEKAIDVEMPGLDKDKVIELKLAGNKDEELYAMLIKAQCRDLYSSMPFLFEYIDDETELLLPDNLLKTDSIIRKLVEEIDEECWENVEIIGWIYQFYISEKKDEVMGKVVKSEDIPAVTQLFTPNWIVKYIVQNSLGRQWLTTYQISPLKQKMEYYIEPAEQTPKIQAEIDAITPKSLNPEEITLIDPACGSGHILVEAYDILKEIYLERGYIASNIPSLILEKNLFGLDIDDRAIQLTGFALMMKARQDNQKILDINPPVSLANFRSIKSSANLNAQDIAYALADGKKVTENDMISLIEIFRDGKTFGSLITIPDDLKSKLSVINEIVEKKHSDVISHDKAEQLKPILDQAILLAGKYNCVVANPPYMGGRYMNKILKSWAETSYPDSKSDAYALFIDRCRNLCVINGLFSLVTIQNWMFLSSFSDLRKSLLDSCFLLQMFHIGPGAFPDLGAFNVLTTTFVYQNQNIAKNGMTRFIRANKTPDLDEKIYALKNCSSYINLTLNSLSIIPDQPIIYWLSKNALENFEKLPLLGSICPPKQGLATGDNNRFVRLWYEVSNNNIKLNAATHKEAKDSGRKWFPYNKGGNYRKWYGNNDCIIDWANDGQSIKAYRPQSVIRNPDYYFREGIVYSLFGWENFGVRYKSTGFVFDVSGSSIFPEEDLYIILAYLCSNVAFYYLKALAPTVNFQVGDLARLPLPQIIDLETKLNVISLAKSNITLCKSDWDASETSWDFIKHSLLSIPSLNLKLAWKQMNDEQELRRLKLTENEETLNRIFISEYRLQDEISDKVVERDISITPGFPLETATSFLSYSIGCMMGRYSLDEAGLIYAHSGNVGFDSTRYKTFPADADGIIPVTDIHWFDDDAANRIKEFLVSVWGKDTLDENMAWLAESLVAKTGETPEETIRRYISSSFFKDHMQTYKKRPIYWLFSSGKQRAFECLVYLHRYNESTLSRMRSEYVTPLQGKLRSRIEFLDYQSKQASSTSEKKKISKELETLTKKQEELKAFDEELRHYADMKIKLDLDDGVKVNYSKFGPLLAEVKAIAAKDED